MECGGVKIQSEHIKDAKENPNFPKPVLSFDVVSLNVLGECLDYFVIYVMLLYFYISSIFPKKSYMLHLSILAF